MYLTTTSTTTPDYTITNTGTSTGTITIPYTNTGSTWGTIETAPVKSSWPFYYNIQEDSLFINLMKELEKQINYSNEDYFIKVKCCGNCVHCKECKCELKENEDIPPYGYCELYFSENNKLENNYLFDPSGNMQDSEMLKFYKRLREEGKI